MLKSLNRLLWQSVKRAAKVQQRQNKKLVKSLLAPAPPLKTTRKKKTSIKRPAKTASLFSLTPLNPTPRKQSPANRTLKTVKTIAIAPALPLPGQWLAGYYNSLVEEHDVPARRMSYWLYLPARATTEALPLVVMLHGCGQSAIQFAAGTRMNHLAEEHGFAVLYPQQSLRNHPQRCWPWYEKSTQSGRREVSLIAGIIEKVIRQYAFDTSRVYAAGLSAGAAMAHILALTHPHLIAAIGLHSGPVFGAGHSRMGAYAVMQNGSALAARRAMSERVDALPIQTPAQSLPIMPAIILHGQADHVVRPINQTQLVQQFIDLNRLDVAHNAPRTMAKPAGRGKTNPSHAYRIQDYLIGRKVVLKVCEIDGLEHAWSGGNCSEPYVACKGPDASKMMWQYFARHRRLEAPLKTS